MMEIIFNGIYFAVFAFLVYLVSLQADRIVERIDSRWRKTFNEVEERHMVEAKEKDKMIFRLAMLNSIKEINPTEFARAIDKIEENEEILSNNELYRRAVDHIQAGGIKNRQGERFGGG